MAQKEMAFDKMCRGWALGTKDFKKVLIAEATEEIDKAKDEDHDQSTKKVARYDGETLREANELRWELMLEHCLQAMGKTATECATDIKSAEWKIMIAAAFKLKTSATNVWIANALNMGVPHAVSRYVGIFKQEEHDQGVKFQELIANITT